MNLKSPGTIMQIGTWLDSAQTAWPSRIDSYIYLRQSGIYQKAKLVGWLDDQGVCGYCKDSPTPQWMETDAGTALCICQIIEIEGELKEAQRLGSTHVHKDLDSFEAWGTPESQDALIRATDIVRDWMGYPDKWLLLAGPFGTGKSHLLQAIKDHFGVWALYVSIPDFEQIVFDTTGDHQMTEAMEVIAKHPILLLDDLGADYGSKYPIAALRRVVDYRYRIWKEFPTVFTTNMSPLQLQQYDGRTADRILDKHVSQVVSFAQVKSWRSNGAHT